MTNKVAALRITLKQDNTTLRQLYAPAPWIRDILETLALYESGRPETRLKLRALSSCLRTGNRKEEGSYKPTRVDAAHLQLAILDELAVNANDSRRSMRIVVDKVPSEPFGVVDTHPYACVSYQNKQTVTLMYAMLFDVVRTYLINQESVLELATEHDVPRECVLL